MMTGSFESQTTPNTERSTTPNLINNNPMQNSNTNNNSTNPNENLQQILIISLSSGFGGFFFLLFVIGAVFVFIKVYCKYKRTNKRQQRAITTTNEENVHQHNGGALAIRIDDNDDETSSVMGGQSNDGSVLNETLSGRMNGEDSTRLLKRQHVMSIDDGDDYRIDATRFMEEEINQRQQQTQETLSGGKYHKKFNSSPSSPLINREDCLTNYQTVPSTSLLLSMLQQDHAKNDDYLGEQNVANSELLIHIRNQHIPKCATAVRNHNTHVENTFSMDWTNYDTFDVTTEITLKDHTHDNSSYDIDQIKSATLKGLLKLSESSESIKKIIFDLHQLIFPSTHSFVHTILSLEQNQHRKLLIEYFLKNYSQDLDSFDEYKLLSKTMGLEISHDDFKHVCIRKSNDFRSWTYPNAFKSWNEFLKSFEGSFEASSESCPTSSKVEVDKSIIKPIGSYFDEFGLIKSPIILSIDSPEVIAQHLTAMDALLLRNVNIHKELILERYANVNCQTVPLYKTDLQYSTSQCPSLSLYIDYFNKLGIFVKFSILYKNLSLQERAVCIERFLQICKHLEKLGNYNSLMGIYGALTSQCISRLKNVWSKVNQEGQDYLTTLDNLFMIRKKFENLRSAQYSRYTPIIPYFGLFMTEMTQIESIHGTTIQHAEHGDKPFVNMVKVGQIFRIHQQIETCQLYASQFISLPIDTSLFNRLQEEIIGFDLLKLEILFEKREKSPSRSISMDSGYTSTSSGNTDASLTPRLSVLHEDNSDSGVSSPTTPRGKKKNISELAEKEFATLSLMICPKRSNSQTGGTPNRVSDSFIGGLWEKLSPKRLSFSNFTLPVPPTRPLSPTSPRRSSVTTVSPRFLSVEDAYQPKRLSDSDSKLIQSKQVTNLSVIQSAELNK